MTSMKIELIHDAKTGEHYYLASRRRLNGNTILAEGDTRHTAMMGLLATLMEPSMQIGGRKHG
jgi:hypothetical protein